MSDLAGGIIQGLGTASAAYGAYTGEQDYLNAGLVASGLGTSLQDPASQTVTETESTTDPTTPVRVRLPSGAVITMYSHGKGVTTKTTKTSGKKSSTGDIINSAVQTAARLYQANKQAEAKKEEEKKQQERERMQMEYLQNERRDRERDFNSSGGLGNTPYGPDRPEDLPPTINSSGGVGSEPYGPEKPTTWRDEDWV